MDRNKIFNKFNGRCAYCGEPLGKRWQADHVVPLYRNCADEELERMGVVRGEDNEDNLVPSCQSCNYHKSTYTVEGFRERIKQFVTALNRDSVQYRMAKKYGLVKETDNEIEFYFEKYGEGKSTTNW